MKQKSSLNSISPGVHPAPGTRHPADINKQQTIDSFTIPYLKRLLNKDFQEKKATV